MSVEYAQLGEWKTELLRNGESSDMNVNGSTTPVIFKYTVPTGRAFLAYHQTMTLIDNAAINADEFGAIRSGLSQGVLMKVMDHNGNLVKDLLDGRSIKRNGDFSTFTGVHVQQLGGNRGLGVLWTWTHATGGRPVYLPPETSICLEVRDDLTRLLNFTSTIQGLLVSEDKS